MAQKKYEYIDSLRGIAILMVIFVHIGVVLDNTLLYFPEDTILHKIIWSGGYGVQLFFYRKCLYAYHVVLQQDR